MSTRHLLKKYPELYGDSGYSKETVLEGIDSSPAEMEVFPLLIVRYIDGNIHQLEFC